MAGKNGAIIPALDDILDPGDGDVLQSGLVDPIWEFQPEIGESEREYQLFLEYCKMPPESRNLSKVFELFSDGRMGVDTYHGLTNLSKRNMWKRRAQTWDLVKEGKGYDSEDWIIKDEKRRVDDFEMGELLRKIAQTRFAKMVDTDEEISPTVALKLLEAATELQEKAIPKLTLEKNKLAQLLSQLPDDRRRSIVAILITKYG